MAWFVAHAVFYFDVPGASGPIQVTENAYLIEADDSEAAWSKAEARAQADAGDSGGTLRVDGQPAHLKYAGIRKVVTPVRDPAIMGQTRTGPTDSPENGTELTYSRFTVSKYQEIEDLVSGKSVSLIYEE